MSSKKECSNACDEDKDCTFSTWNENGTSCQLLSGLEKIVLSKNGCSKACDDYNQANTRAQDKNKKCTHWNWNETGEVCQLLNGLKEIENGKLHLKKDNPPYFCQKNGFQVNEKEVLCKPVSHVIHESQGKSWTSE